MFLPQTLVQHWNFQHTFFPHPSLRFLTFNTFCLILAKSLPFPNPLSFWLTQSLCSSSGLQTRSPTQPNKKKKNKKPKHCLAHSPSPGLQAPSLPAHSPPSPFPAEPPWCQFPHWLCEFSIHNLNYSRNDPTPSYQHSLTTGRAGKGWCKKRGVCNADTQQVMRAFTEQPGERLSISMSYCSLSETQHPAWIDKQKLGRWHEQTHQDIHQFEVSSHLKLLFSFQVFNPFPPRRSLCKHWKSKPHRSQGRKGRKPRVYASS